MFVIPEPEEVDWGSNLDAYFVAIAAGCLQKTGGNFTLSAETDFGASFGLKALSYKSRTANPATTGAVRLASADVIAWRNHANSANLPLTTDASDNLLYNGNPLVAGAATTFAPNRVAGTDSGGILSVLSPGTAGMVLTSNGASAPTFQNTTGSGTVNSGDAGLLALYPANGSTVDDSYVQNGNPISVVIQNIPDLSTDRTYTIPDSGADSEFVMAQGDQTVDGVKTFNAVTEFPAGAEGLSFFADDALGAGGNGTQGTLTLLASDSNGGLLFRGHSNGDSVYATVENATQADDRTYTIPDAGEDATFLMSTGIQTVFGGKTFLNLALGGDLQAGHRNIIDLAPGNTTGDAVEFDQMNAAIGAAVGVSLPPGVWFPYGGSSAPTGYLLCDGASYLRATYPALFAVIGTTFGSADGTHFNVPAPADLTLVGASGTKAAGSTGGSPTAVVPSFTTTLANIGSPVPTAQGDKPVGLVDGAGDGLFTLNGGGSADVQQKSFTSDTTGGFVLATVSPYLATKFIIKT